MITVGSLFSGIGGIDLGLERAGLNVIWQCEVDDFCKSILDKQWPNTPVYKNIKNIYTDDGKQPEKPEVLCGGFPCQDISFAGKGAGLEGDRSKLWWEYWRVIRSVEPEYAIVENPTAIYVRGFDKILGSLAEIGYDAEWEVLPAAAFGARHRRDRAFMVAYPNKERLQGRNGQTSEERGQVLRTKAPPEEPFRWDITSPAICRAADGLPNRVDRVKTLGNAVVPQVAEFVGLCIKEHYNH